MPCMCGDAECPSCGPAQGTLPDQSVIHDVTPDIKPLVPCEVYRSKAVLDEIIRRAEAEGISREDALAHIRRADLEQARNGEAWQNDLYVVIVKFLDGHRNGRICIEIHRHDRSPDIPWKHKQQIKNHVAGEDREAIELYPREDRLVDTANSFWLWVLPVGYQQKWPHGRGVIGFETRMVLDDIPGWNAAIRGSKRAD